MWIYCLKLAWLSLRKAPVMSALTVLTVAVGIAICLIMVTLYSVISNNPMQHKNDSIFAVQLDSWGEDEPFPGLNGLPSLLTYRDARALYDAGIASHTVITFRSGLNVGKAGGTEPPKMEFARPTTNDFFAMFDVPFIYGKPWSDSLDSEGARVAVIAEALNQRIFGGKNSVGEAISIDDELFTVVGVVSERWQLLPTVYDLQSNPFDQPPQVYLPLFSVRDMAYPTWSGRWARQYEDISNHEDFINSEMMWLLAWLGFDNAEQKQKAKQFLHQYVKDQHSNDRFPRPPKFQLSSPTEWLEIHQIVKQDDRVLLGLSFAFLLVCLLNGAVLLLAKQFRKANETGIRRALGASRADIFVEHLAESLLIAATGSVIGVVLAHFGLKAVQALYNNYDAVAVINSATVISAIALAVAATLVSGAVPAWKVSLTPAAKYLKAQ